MTPVYQIVQEKLQELISSGEIGLGQRLPSERDLAERFRVSRNSVREAIRGLTEKNVLESRRGDGTYLRGGREDLPALPLGRTLESDARRLKEIFELRRMLEPQIAALAAGQITKRDLKALKMLVFEQEKRHMCRQDDAELDAAFHLRIAEAANNKLIVEVLRTLDHILAESRSEEVRSEERQRVSMRTHYLIVDALERRDPDAAKEAMIAHLLDVEAAILGTEKR
jgi:GntR family transcriptional regulator, transcriptional repressor for pyruvate dehydrogenase complex